MEYTTNKTTTTHKPSRLATIIALIIAFALPYLLMKAFHHKPREKTTRLTLSLPSPVTSDHASQTPQNDALSHAHSTTLAESLAKEQEWKIIQTKEGDTLAIIFRRAGIDSSIMYKMLNDIPHASELKHLKPNQDLQMRMNGKQLEQLVMPLTSTQYLTISLKDGHFVSQVNSRKMNSHHHFVTATVHGSLYGTAKKQGIPYKLINQMTNIFNWSIDFSRDVREGDQFTLIYQAYYTEDKLVGTGEVLAVSYRNRNTLFQAIRHSDENGHTNYYSPEGMSLKKAFDRYPLRFSHISSTFSLSRNHPILHQKRAHKGVDLAARLGTPIHATGDGRIAFIGWQNGYGNMVKIQHNKTYTTVYGHMLKFRKGLSKGDTVRKDDIIGYVGQTGLATGPHCHYEFRIENQPKNPSTIDLPRSMPLSGRELVQFKYHANTLLAQLKLYEEGQLASASALKEKHAANLS